MFSVRFVCQQDCGLIFMKFHGRVLHGTHYILEQIRITGPQIQIHKLF